MSTLPIANKETVRLEAKKIVRRHRKELVAMLSLYTFASACSLVGPWVIGQFVDLVKPNKLHHIALTATKADQLVLILLISSLAAGGFQFLGRRRSYVLG